MVGRSPVAARQLASRARRRVKGADQRPPETDVGRQREVVDAFFAAARGGKFDALLAVLDPDVVLRVDGGANLPAASLAIRGAEGVARQAGRGLRSWLARPGVELRSALVIGSAGVIITVDGEPVNVMAFTVVDGKIREIDSVADPDRLRSIGAIHLSGG